MVKFLMHHPFISSTKTLSNEVIQCSSQCPGMLLFKSLEALKLDPRGPLTHINSFMDKTKPCPLKSKLQREISSVVKSCVRANSYLLVISFETIHFVFRSTIKKSFFAQSFPN